MKFKIVVLSKTILPIFQMKLGRIILAVFLGIVISCEARALDFRSNNELVPPSGGDWDTLLCGEIDKWKNLKELCYEWIDAINNNLPHRLKNLDICLYYTFIHSNPSSEDLKEILYLLKKELNVQEIPGFASLIIKDIIYAYYDQIPITELQTLETPIIDNIDYIKDMEMQIIKELQR